MKTKTMALVVMLLCCLYAPVAHSADAQFSVNGKTISCTVQDISTRAGEQWIIFTLKYEFCNGNRVTYTCFSKRKGGLVPGGNVKCFSGPEPKTQECNAAQYTFVNYYDIAFDLYDGTRGAQKYVCEEQFKRMTVSVEPLK